MSDSTLAPGPHHRLHTCCRLGPLRLQTSLELSADWTVLFGPSGSGKSSLLRAACGLLPCPGVVFERRVEGGEWKPLQNGGAGLPPHRRGLRWAPQHASVFPHMTVQENVEFGMRSAGSFASATSREQMAAAIDLFRLGPLLSRKPGSLSGGERQRVNLARAFTAPNCHLMLLDEPFNGIDRPLRDELLPQMREWLRNRNIPALSVTHDVEEALRLEAHVVLLRDGKIEGEGPASEVLAAERARILRNLAD